MSARNPRVFISYSHADHVLAERIASYLRENGIDAWFDGWEILAGDSLIQKIFQEGLAGAEAFVILLSEYSIDSNWVQHELDVALIRRLEGITRVIPVKLADIQVPNSLIALRWLDLSHDFEEGLGELRNTILQVRQRPVLGAVPEIAGQNLPPVKGLSRLGTALGFNLLPTGNHETGSEETFSVDDIAARLGFTPEETDDAIDELENLGLIKTETYLGSHPYNHSEIEPTYALFLHFNSHNLPYSAEQDVRVVAATIVAVGEQDGNALQVNTGLTPLRINRAVGYLGDFGLVEIQRWLGSGPYDFGSVAPTGATRRFVEEMGG